MGKALVVSRLAVRDIRHRPAQAIMLLLVITAAAATLALSLSLQGTTSNPYLTTRAATNGPDVVASIFPNGPNAPGPATTAHPGSPGVSVPPGARTLMPLEHAAGVAAYSGPFPVTWTLLRTGRTTTGAEVEGRGIAPAPVDRPRLLRGSWLRPGQVVVEAAFASAYSIHVGDRISLGGVSVTVAGIAVTAAIPDYPDTCVNGCFITNQYNPGLVWATPADTRAIARDSASTPYAYFLNLKLAHPAQASAFAARHDAVLTATSPYLMSWQHIQAGDAQVIAKVQTGLFAASWLLALLALASVVVLAGGRMAEQTRRVGLLKAVGGTPWLIAVVLLAEHVLIGLVAAGTGLAAGWLTAPLLDRPGAGLLGAASAPSFSAATAGLVIALALAVAILATFVPAIRAARQSTVAALEDAARTPARQGAVIRFSAGLPAALLLGVRLAWRRPRRLVLSVFSIAVAATGLVAVLIVHTTHKNGFLGPKLGAVTVLISVMLVLLAAVNAVFIAWATALDARHPAALARALGATPDQITAGVSLAQLIPALAGALLGIGGGIAVSAALRHQGTVPVPPALWLVVLVAAILLAVSALTAIPVRIGARRPVTEALQAE